MRTLKKVLALTVVLATMFSLTAFAAFTDADQINESCQDDINLMNALNVMVGDAEGTFRPNGTISRAEAAKMVYVVRNGGVDDKASGWTGMKVFNDVPAGAWYEGYVNYCASLGIIAGVGGNKFNPDGAVTGVELAKMMLVVADYKPDVEGYTGANWSLNVINDAQQANMFDGYALAFSASAPRQWAAKLFSNAILKTRTAVYFGGERINDVANLGTSQTVGTKYFNLRMVKGYLIGTENVKEKAGSANANASTQKSTIALTEDMGSATTDLKAGQAFSFIYNAPVELLQQEVYVVVDTLNEKVYNVYPTEKSAVYDVNFADVTFKFAYEGDGKTVKNTELGIAFEGYSNTTYKTDTSNLPITFYRNNALDTAITNVTPTSLKTEVDAKNNFGMRMVDRDGDGMIDVVFVTESDYAVVTSYNAARNVFTAGSHRANGNAEKFAEYNFVDSVNVGDVVKITADDTGKNLAYNVERLSAAVSGQITKTSNDNKAFTVSGTEYALSKNAATTTPDFKDNLKLGNEVDLYTDGKYVVYAALTGKSLITELSSNLAYVIDKGTVKGGDKWGDVTQGDNVNKVQVLLADNTTKVYTYAADDDVDADTQVAFSAATVDKVYEYVLTGETIVFKKAIEKPAGVEEGTTSVTTKQLNATKKTFDGMLMDDDTWFFVKSKNSKGAYVYAVMKASEFTKDVDGKASQQVIYQPVSGINTVMVGVLSTESVISNSVEDYVFTTTDWYNTVVDGKAIKAVDVINSDGEAVTLTLTSTTNVAAYRVYTVTTASGKSTLSTAKFTLDALTGANASGVLQFETAGTKTAASNIKVWYLDCDPASGKTVKVDGDGYPLSEKVEGVYNKNVLFRVSANDSSVVTDLYIEVDGDAFGKIAAKSAVAAVYKTTSDVTKETLSAATNKVSIGGEDVNVTSSSTIDTVKDGLTASAWVVTKSADGTGLVFTAKTAGALDAAGAPTTAQTANMVKVTEGVTATAATITGTITVATDAISDGGDNDGKYKVSFNGTDAYVSDNTDFSAIAAALSIAAPSGYSGTVTAASFTFTADAVGAKTETNPLPGATFTNGKDAVKAVYKVDDIAGKITAATSSSATLTIIGQGYTVTEDTLAGQLTQWAAAYNKDSANKLWIASVGTGEDASKIVFTAKVAGALKPENKTDGTTAPQTKPHNDTTLATEGADAE